MKAGGERLLGAGQQVADPLAGKRPEQVLVARRAAPVLGLVELILVFDAYRVEGGQERVFNYHNIHVVFTKEAETADQYIEKTVHKIGKKADVTVATSDALEQVIIYGQGARRMAARELLEEVELTREKVLERIEKRPGSTQKQLTENDHNYLFDHLPEELVSYMEEVRLGKREL